MEVSQIGYKYHFYIIFRGISWGSTVFFTRPISSEESCGAKQGFGNRTTLWGLQWLGQAERKLHQQNVSLRITVG